MLNDRSIQAVRSSTFGPHFRRPLYNSYNFADVPNSLPWLFTGEGRPALSLDVFGPYAPPFDHVAFCFIDAFGWHHVERALETSVFLRHARDEGVLSQLTAMFPSTTAAHVTTVHTGQLPIQSGVYAWQYLEPQLGTIIEALPYSLHGGPREGLRHAALDPASVFPGPSLYSRLQQIGVRSFVLQSSEIAGSSCNSIYTEGAEKRPFKALSEALVTLRNILLNEEGPTYSFLYWDRIDSAGHTYGWQSDEAAAEVEMVFQGFDRLLHAPLQSRAKGRTLLLITADHGHMNNGDCFFINNELPEVVPLLQSDRLGRPLALGGGRRNCFLYVQPAHVDAVVERLRQALTGRAEVYRTRELSEAGFFGPGPASQRFEDRIAPVVVLPYANHSVWWDYGRPGEKKSSHGGLTPDEMEIPLFVALYG